MKERCKGGKSEAASRIIIVESWRRPKLHARIPRPRPPSLLLSMIVALEDGAEYGVTLVRLSGDELELAEQHLSK
jgi:hypothetical protein